MLPPTTTPPAIVQPAAPPFEYKQSRRDDDPADFVLKPTLPGQVIGQAVLQEDGNILVVLDLRFVAHDAVVHQSYGYTKGTKGFDDVVADLGPFKPGVWKTVYAKGLFAP